jgi:hypothetical protein
MEFGGISRLDLLRDICSHHLVGIASSLTIVVLGFTLTLVLRVSNREWVSGLLSLAY